MAETITIPRIKNPVYLEPNNPDSFIYKDHPGWSMVTSMSGKTVHPMVYCNCGKQLSIGRHHIHKDGRVTASFYHKEPHGCGWHVHLILKDWIEEEILPVK